MGSDLRKGRLVLKPRDPRVSWLWLGKTRLALLRSIRPKDKSRSLVQGLGGRMAAGGGSVHAAIFIALVSMKS